MIITITSFLFRRYLSYSVSQWLCYQLCQLDLNRSLDVINIITNHKTVKNRRMNPTNFEHLLTAMIAFRLATIGMPATTITNLVVHVITITNLDLATITIMAMVMVSVLIIRNIIPTADTKVMQIIINSNSVTILNLIAMTNRLVSCTTFSTSAET